MYSIIIAIHVVFIFLSHLLGYRFFEWFFILLCIFFLFFFSPLFFLDSETIPENSGKKYFNISTFFKNLSPKDSILLPLTLLYIALYGFVIWLFGFGESILLIHSILSIGIFLILFWYILSFEWRNDMFYEVFRFHSIISFFSTILFGILSFPQNIHIPIFSLVLGIFSVWGGIFLLSSTKEKLPVYTTLFLSSFLSILFLTLQFLWHSSIYSLFLTIIVVFWIITFEFFPNIPFFSLQKTSTRYFSLFLLLFSLPFLCYSLFSDITLPFFLLTGVLIFSLSIHIRYSNYVAYGIGLGIIYFLYSVFFFSLLSSGSLFSVLLFIFFLPFLLIGITYFWEEQYEYDFIILHYSSVMFSGIYSIYSIFFIWWGPGFLFFLSSCILGLAVLFFLSYFRFRKA